MRVLFQDDVKRIELYLQVSEVEVMFGDELTLEDDY